MKFFSLVSTAAAVAFTSVFAGDLVSHQTGGNGGSYSSSYQNVQSVLQQTMCPQNTLECARVCSTGDGFYTDLEFLWLRAVEDGIDYAWEVTNQATANINGRNIKAKNQDFEFDPGFRVGVGYNRV